MTLPTETVNYLYDGSGTRVAMQSTANGTTTLTSYIGSIEEVQTTGSSTQTTTYYTVGGKRVAADVNGALGSQVAVLNATGSLVGAQLYGPYGSSRYTTGTLPTSIGFTGQRADSVTGLDYYNARYYDPVVGQFLSVDSVQGNAQGMDPYAYVGGNPESRTDPTGHFGDPGFGSPLGGGSGIHPCLQPGGFGCVSGIGGGNKGGGGTKNPTPTKPKPPSKPQRPTNKHNPSPWKAKFGDAQMAAYNAVRAFAISIFGFGVLAGGFHVIAGVLEGASLPLWLSEFLAPFGLTADTLAAQFEALSVAAAVLTAEATLLTTLFGFQANFGSDWWSERSNITSFFDGINQIIEVIGSATAVISAGLAWFTRFVPEGLIKVLGAGTWLGALGVTAANAGLFRSWSQKAERDELHAMFGN